MLANTNEYLVAGLLVAAAVYLLFRHILKLRGGQESEGGCGACGGRLCDFTQTGVCKSDASTQNETESENTGETSDE